MYYASRVFSHQHSSVTVFGPHYEPKELQDLLSKFVVDPVCTPQEDIYFLHKSGQNVIGEMEKPVAESLFVKPSAQPKKYFEAK